VSLRVSTRADKSAGVGILRLRKTTRFAGRLASLRMTNGWSVCTLFWMMALGVTLLLSFSIGAGATTYYVSFSVGNDTNNGTSTATPWQTIAHVNGQTFLPGDAILFKRGDVWNESLAPPSSGTSGNPITFDAYGTGAAPNLTGYYAVQPSAWMFVSGNAWKARVPSTYSSVNFCLFGSIWGQKVAAATANLTAQWDFYLASGFIYVFSSENPATYYGNAPIVPMALSNVPVINVNGKTWLTFQHVLVNWFDEYGVYVQGASDHLVFANMEADSMIPQGTQPLGFYVNESAPGPSDIKIYNSEAHLNYDAFRFDGAATAITMGTNHFAARSASRWMGARLRCAWPTSCTMRASKVSLPTRSARITNEPVPFTVAPTTRSPACLALGIGSPVTIDSSIALDPSIITPSTGIFSPGLTRRRSPTATLSSAISLSTPSSPTR